MYRAEAWEQAYFRWEQEVGERFGLDGCVLSLQLTGVATTNFPIVRVKKARI